MDSPTNETILRRFSLLSFSDGGIGSWLSETTVDFVFHRLATIEQTPLSKVQLNQLLAFAHEAPLSYGFFKYYWLTRPDGHPYDVASLLPEWNEQWTEKMSISSLDHLYWGLYRLYVDGLLWFGNIRTAYRALRTQSFDSLVRYFVNRRFNTEELKKRGPALGLVPIARDDRYLISEMACKSYGDTPQARSELRDVLTNAYREYRKNGGGPVKIRELLDVKNIPSQAVPRQGEFIFSADDVLEQEVETLDDLNSRYDEVASKFVTARESGLRNTYLYLSMVGELDVYVATSMRTRQDFRSMADIVTRYFSLVS